MIQALITTMQKVVPVSDADAGLISSCFKRKDFKRNELVLQAGSVAREVYFVVRGLMHQYYIDDAGNERTCDFTFSNQFSTDLESFTKKNPATSFIKALKATSCLSITCDELMQLIKESNAARDFFNTVIESIAAESMSRTKSFLISSPEHRFRELLVQKPDIFQLVPQRYIAQYLGIAPESLSRIKKRLMVAAKS